MRAKLPGDYHLVEVVHCDTGFIHQRREPREDGALGQLDLTHIALRYEHALGGVGEDKRALAVVGGDDDLAAEIVFCEFVGLDERPVFAHDAAAQELAHHGEDAAAAKSCWLYITDDRELVARFGNADFFDSAFGGAHARADVHALERRTGSARTREQPALRGEHDLAVRADVDEKHVSGLFVQLADVGARHDVGADVCRHVGEAIQPRSESGLDANMRSG